MSWKAEIITEGSFTRDGVPEGAWCSNALRFTTREEAEAYLWDLASRWTSVRDTRATECDDPANVGPENDQDRYDHEMGDTQ